MDWLALLSLISFFGLFAFFFIYHLVRVASGRRNRSGLSDEQEATVWEHGGRKAIERLQESSSHPDSTAPSPPPPRH